MQNITLQNQCPQDASDHISIPYDSNALQDMINALGPDSSGFQPSCASVGADHRQRLTSVLSRLPGHAPWPAAPPTGGLGLRWIT